jgi:hypothetical protein
MLARNLAKDFLGNHKETVSEALAGNIGPGGVKK